MDSHLLQIAQGLFEVVLPQIVTHSLGHSEGFPKTGVGDLSGRKELKSFFDGLVGDRTYGRHRAFHDHFFPDISFDVIDEFGVQTAIGKQSGHLRSKLRVFSSETSEMIRPVKKSRDHFTCAL